MKKLILIVAAFLIGTGISYASPRYVGGDISLLPEYEEAGAKYKDHSGKPISDLLPFLREEGMNAMRVRLFVDPAKYKGSDKDANACQTLDYIVTLCKRIVDDGFDLIFRHLGRPGKAVDARRLERSYRRATLSEDL